MRFIFNPLSEQRREIHAMAPMSLVTVVLPRTGKIIKNVFVFERGENLLHYGILHSVF